MLRFYFGKAILSSALNQGLFSRPKVPTKKRPCQNRGADFNLIVFYPYKDIKHLQIKPYNCKGKSERSNPFVFFRKTMFYGFYYSIKIADKEQAGDNNTQHRNENAYKCVADNQINKFSETRDKIRNKDNDARNNHC